MGIAMTAPSEPVFVVGMNGSGTTMLLDSLGRHPELYSFPYETRLFPYLAAQERLLDDLQDDAQFQELWEEVLGLAAFVRANGDARLPLPEDWYDCSRSLAGVLDTVMLGFAATENKARWCEKSPQYAQHLQLLHGLFPTARFIHVVRDGRDCAASFNRRWLRSPRLTMYRWKRLLRDCRRQMQSVPEELCFEVRYEDLTSEPDVWLRKLCDFLRVPFSENILESSQPYMQSDSEPDMGRAETSLRRNTGKWRTYFAPATQRELERIGGKTLYEFGYATEYPDSDNDLSGLEYRILVLRDGAAQLIREVGLKLSGKIERPWRVILAKPFSARKQRAHNKF